MRSVGFKRVAHLISIILVICWSILIVDELNSIKGMEWALVLSSYVVAYLIPHIMLKAVYWVADGFAQDKESRKG